MSAISYDEQGRPVTMHYLIDADEYLDWGLWPVLREIISNAIDTRAEWDIKFANGRVRITDEGSGISPNLLIIGKSGHEKGGEFIGRFGEGLKMALLTLAKMGIEVTLKSQDYILTHHLQEELGSRTLVLSLYYPGTRFKGTEITFDWPQKETYIDRFLKFRNKYTFDVLYEDDNGQIIKEGTPAIYQQGIWIQDTEDFGLSYNLPHVELERDRAYVNAQDVKRKASQLWKFCNEPRAWKEFFRASGEDTWNERNMTFWHIQHKDVVKEAFFNYYGPSACLFTSERAARLAGHFGHHTVLLGYNTRYSLEDVVPTDLAIIDKQRNKERRRVPDEELDSYAYETLCWLREIGRIAGYWYDTYAYEIEEGSSEAFYLGSEKTIGINLDLMFDRNEALAAFLEEVTHAVCGTEDETQQHQLAVLATAAKIIQSTNKGLPDE